jgi:hypothetical protein
MGKKKSMPYGFKDPSKKFRENGLIRPWKGTHHGKIKEEREQKAET